MQLTVGKSLAVTELPSQRECFPSQNGEAVGGGDHGMVK